MAGLGLGGVVLVGKPVAFRVVAGPGAGGQRPVFRKLHIKGARVHHRQATPAASCTGCAKCHHGYTGGGVLLVDEKTGDIILTLENHSKTYSDPGGLLDKKERCSDAASRETFEETRGTVDISPETLRACKYIDVGGFHKYRCYIYKTGGQVSCRAYYKVDTRNLSSAFRETSAMTRFPIKGIKAELAKNYKAQWWVGIKDNQPTTLPVRGRVMGIVRRAITAGLI